MSHTIPTEIADAAREVGEVLYFPSLAVRSHPDWPAALRAEIARRREVSIDPDYLARWVSPLIQELGRAEW